MNADRTQTFDWIWITMFSCIFCLVILWGSFSPMCFNIGLMKSAAWAELAVIMALATHLLTVMHMLYTQYNCWFVVRVSLFVVANTNKWIHPSCCACIFSGCVYYFFVIFIYMFIYNTAILYGNAIFCFVFFSLICHTLCCFVFYCLFSLYFSLILVFFSLVGWNSLPFSVPFGGLFDRTLSLTFTERCLLYSFMYSFMVYRMVV